MTSKLCIITLVGLFFIGAVSGYATRPTFHDFDDKVDIEVYYGSLSPLSRDFMTRYLQNVIHKLAGRLNVYMYPFGLGKIETKDGVVQISCENGYKECYGNKLHACSLYDTKNTTVAHLFNICMMNFSHMGHGSDDIAAEKCGATINVNVNAIKFCAKNQLGARLLKHYGEVTKAMEPDRVPYITVSSEQSIRTRSNFMTKVCNAFEDPPFRCTSKAMLEKLD